MNPLRASRIELDPDQVTVAYYKNGDQGVGPLRIKERSVISVYQKNIGYTHFEVMPEGHDNSIKALLLTQELHAARNSHRPLFLTKQKGEGIKVSKDYTFTNHYLWLDSEQPTMGIEAKKVVVQLDEENKTLVYLIDEVPLYTEKYSTRRKAKLAWTNQSKKIDAISKNANTLRFDLAMQSNTRKVPKPLPIISADPIKPYQSPLYNEDILVYKKSLSPHNASEEPQSPSN